MTVLVFPNRIKGNPYFASFVRGLQGAGLQDVRLSRVLQLKSGFDAVHLHHPEHAVTQGGLLRSAALTSALLAIVLYARFSRLPVIWMVHDVEPAWVRREAILGLFMTAITKLTTGHVFLNNSSQILFYTRRPQEKHKPFCVAPHSRYQTVLFGPEARREHRESFGVGPDDLLISFLGDIKPHKGLECAALIPGRTASGRPVKVAICGQIEDTLPDDYVDNIMGAAPHQSYVRVADRLTDEDLALWIQSSDAVFLPYRTGSNSGMAMNVLSNHGRVISSDLPMFRELAERCGPTWLKCVDASDAVEVGKAVDDMERWMEQKPDVARLEAMLTEGDPVENGRRLFNLYSSPRRRKMRPFAAKP